LQQPLASQTTKSSVGRRERLWLSFDKKERRFVAVETGDSVKSTKIFSIGGFCENIYGVKALFFIGHRSARSKHRRRVIIAFRPSYNRQNWRENMFCIPTKPSGLEKGGAPNSWAGGLRDCVVHAGFEESVYKSGLCQWLGEELRRVMADDEGLSPRVYIAGISLGGALAFLVNRFVRQQIEEISSFPARQDVPELIVFTFGAPQAGNRHLNLHLMEGKVVRFQFQNDKDRLAKLPGFPPFTHHQGATYTFDISPDPPQAWDWVLQNKNKPSFIRTLKHNMHHCCYAGTWFRYPIKNRDLHFWEEYLATTAAKMTKYHHSPDNTGVAVINTMNTASQQQDFP
jgi:hypothetical protein